MSEPIYKFFTGRFLPDWYELSKEEQNSLLAKLHEALEKLGAKTTIRCNTYWSTDHWAYRNQQRVRAIAYMETFVAPLTLDDLPESFHPTLKAVRSSEGEALVLDENMFIEKMLPGVTQRTLSVDEMEEYRRPFLESGDGRWPTLQWPREVPLSGDPADVHDRIFAYSTWLNTASLPKLFIDADPGVFITGRVRKLAKNFPNQHHVVVKGLHFVQEDSPDEIGQAITGWLERI
jgi:haloalkane dehalogenase